MHSPRLLLLGVALLLASGAGARPTASRPGTRTDTVRAARVIDGDTIQLTDGRMVRYLGLDTPEMRRRVGEQWVVDPQRGAVEATAANRRLVEGRPLRLAFDVQTHDRYGRWLAYVYADEVFVNAALVCEGWATLMTIPPNVREVNALRACEAEARQHQRGLWAGR